MNRSERIKTPGLINPYASGRFFKLGYCEAKDGTHIPFFFLWVGSERIAQRLVKVADRVLGRQ